jgi:uncharacterized cupin superfamily protein
MIVPPGYASEQVVHEGEEIVYILDGEIAQVVDGSEYVMTPGDSMHFLGTSPHSWSNKTDRQARLLWVGLMHYDQSGELQQIRPDVGAMTPRLVPLRP